MRVCGYKYNSKNVVQTVLNKKKMDIIEILQVSDTQFSPKKLLISENT
jgi:hypothetical protein